MSESPRQDPLEKKPEMPEKPGAEPTRPAHPTAGVTLSPTAAKPAAEPAAAGPAAAESVAELPAEPAVRASDADRDRVADILREALAEGRLDPAEHSERLDAVYAAKTVGELQPVVRDLPAGRGAGEQREPAVAYETAAACGPLGRAKENLVAICSGSVRKGRFRVPRKINAVALCGGVVIDLSEAVFEHQYVQINATAICGGVEIRVPENVTLRQKGVGICGGFDVRTTESEDPQAPVVLVEGVAICGGVEAKQKKGKRLRDLRWQWGREG